MDIGLALAPVGIVVKRLLARVIGFKAQSPRAMALPHGDEACRVLRGERQLTAAGNARGRLAGVEIEIAAGEFKIAPEIAQQKL